MPKTSPGSRRRVASRSITGRWRKFSPTSPASNVFQIVVERGAEKDLKRLSNEIRDRAVTAIKALASNPRPAGCRKLTGADDAWRIRIGDYRIIYEIGDVLRIVRINHVRHRREVY